MLLNHNLKIYLAKQYGVKERMCRPQHGDKSHVFPLACFHTRSVVMVI